MAEQGRSDPNMARRRGLAFLGAITRFQEPGVPGPESPRLEIGEAFLLLSAQQAASWVVPHVAERKVYKEPALQANKTGYSK